MIRTLSFHPLSLLVGLVLGIACLLAMGQSPPSPAFRIEYGPAPRDMVQIAPGTTYAVPAGKVFVPTALGSSAFGVPVARLIVNDQPVLGVADYTNSLYLTSMYPVCEAMAIPDGSVISIRTPPGGNLGQAWGYLANKLTESPGSPPTYRVAYSPHPSDLVQVTLGTPYVVPPGKVFTLTGLGVASGINAPPTVFSVGGQPVCTSPGSYGGLDQLTMTRVPAGCTVAAGETITVTSSNPAFGPRAWGYLADQ